MSTIVTRSVKGSALSFTEMDSNFSNLNTDKLENITSENLTDLSDVVQTGTPADNELLAYDTGTSKWINQTAAEAGLSGLTSFSVTTGAASGAGALAYNNTTGVFTFNPVDTSLVLTEVEEDTAPVLGGNLDVNTFSITTTVTDGNVTLTANGTGAVEVSSAGGAVIGNTGASGYGVISGDASVGIGLATDDFSQAATDPQLLLTSGGGATLTAGTGSALALTGSSLTLTGATSLTNLNDFVETVHASTTTTGTYAPDATDGTIHYVSMTGSMTINGFTSPSEGQTISLFFDGTGGTYTLTLGASILTPAGDGVTLTDGGYDIVTITCIDDTTPVYVATPISDFQ